MSTLYLIRHGQASFGSADYDQLSPLGYRQARRLGERFLGAGIRFDACWSGTLKRQRQTAEAIRACCREDGVGLPEIEQIEAFNEYEYGPVLRALIPIIEAEDPTFSRDVKAMFDGQRSFQKVFGRVMARWAGARDDLGSVGAWSAFCDQVAGGINEILSGCPRSSHVAVFTSGGPIAAFVGRVMGLAPENTIALSWQVVNASQTRFRFGRGEISLVSFNEQGHLEGDGTESLVTYR